MTITIMLNSNIGIIGFEIVIEIFQIIINKIMKIGKKFSLTSIFCRKTHELRIINKGGQEKIKTNDKREHNRNEKSKTNTRQTTNSHVTMIQTKQKRQVSNTESITITNKKVITARRKKNRKSKNTNNKTAANKIGITNRGAESIMNK